MTVFARALAGAAAGLGALVISASAVAEALPGHVLERALAAVVSVLPEWPARKRRLAEPEGSGVVVLDGRTIATALHVLDDARIVRVRTADGRILDARLGPRDEATDIALLEIDEPLATMPMARSDPPLGAPVCAIGNTFGLDLSITCGVVSGVHRAGMGFNAVEDFVQTDAAVNPGDSGGALVNAQGEMVGLLSAIFTKTSDANIGVNFAISAPLLAHVVGELKANGRVRRPTSGLRLERAPRAGGTGHLAARVASVAPQSAAERAGFAVDDLIVKANGRPIRAPADFVGVMGTVGAQGTVAVEVIRGGERRTLTLQF